MNRKTENRIDLAILPTLAISVLAGWLGYLAWPLIRAVIVG